MAIATFCLVGCSQRGEIAVSLWDETSPESTSLLLDVPACDSSPELQVVETEVEVIVTVTADKNSGCSTSCADSVTVELQEPLGDRKVIDSSTGKEVPKFGNK